MNILLYYGVQLQTEPLLLNNLKSVFPRSDPSHRTLTDIVTFFHYITIVSGI